MTSPQPQRPATPRDWVALRSPRDIADLDRAAGLAWRAARAGLRACRPGVTTREVGEVVRQCITSHGGGALFEGYHPPAAVSAFPGPACISVNDQAVHAPPGDRVLRAGDLVTVDVGVTLDGWCGDVAESVVLPGGDAGHEQLLVACRRAVAAGVRACGPGVQWSAVARAIRAAVAAEDCVVLPGFSGHGVGQGLHEPPRAGYRTAAGDRADFTLLPGMVLTIEPIVTRPPGGVVHDADGWTVRTADGTAACHVERMVAVTRHGVRVLGLPGRCFRAADGL